MSGPAADTFEGVSATELRRRLTEAGDRRLDALSVAEAQQARREQAALVTEVAAADVIITTAAVPGRKAPTLLTTAMVEAMADGSLIVDMAADGGGNCELTVAGEVVDHRGVSVVGLSNPPAAMGRHASTMYANNVVKLLALYGHGEVAPDWADEVVAGATVTSGGLVHHRPTAEALGVEAVPVVAPTPTEPAEAEESK